MKRQLNQAHFEIKGGVKSAEDKVTLDRGGSIEWLNVQADKPGAKCDLKITDQWGNTIVEKKIDTGKTTQFGERISLPLTDSYYTIKVDNVEGAEVLDAFLD